jgi:hypothetical protein
MRAHTLSIKRRTTTMNKHNRTLVPAIGAITALGTVVPVTGILTFV